MNTIDINGKAYPFILQFKNIKNVHLKVYPEQTVLLSVPLDTPNEWIDRFLISKQNWLCKQMGLYASTAAIEKEPHTRNGSSNRILGVQKTVRVLCASHRSIENIDRFLTVYTPEAENQAAVDRQMNAWWQKNSKMYFKEVLDRLYPIIGKHGIAKPTIVVKKMKTLWGSCSPRKNRINLNFYLYKASVPCIDYVILHELIHFLYPKHNKDFYDFITIHMPDWEQRKRTLDYETVLGV